VGEQASGQASGQVGEQANGRAGERASERAGFLPGLGIALIRQFARCYGNCLHFHSSPLGNRSWVMVWGTAYT